jgi:molybdopterin synthase sulfur carrier subunit
VAIVWIPALYRDLTGGDEKATVPGDTVREVIENLEARYPGVRARLYRDSDERLRPGVAVVVDGVVIRGQSRALREPLTETSEVHFLPAISGGVEPGQV